MLLCLSSKFAPFVFEWFMCDDVTSAVAGLLILKGRCHSTGSLALSLFPLQTVTSTACGLLYAPAMIKMISFPRDSLVGSSFLLHQQTLLPAQSSTIRQPEAKDLSMFASIFDRQ